MSIFPRSTPQHPQALLVEASLRRAAYDTRKGERSPNPNNLSEIDVLLWSPDWEYLGKSSDGEQICQGFTGPPGLESLLFVFLNVITRMNITASVFSHGTIKVVRDFGCCVVQLLIITTSEPTV